MPTKKSTPKSLADRLTLLEEERTFLKEMPNTMHFLETQLVEIDEKVGDIDAKKPDRMSFRSKS